jgi:hypothetical protein
VGEILGSCKLFCRRHIDWQENVKHWNDLRGWADANAAALRLCFRMTVAGLLAYVLAELFLLPRGYWAVFSAIIIVQASVGGSVKATMDRVIGTIGGAVAGGAAGYLLPHESVLSLGVALIIALVPLTLVAALWPHYRIAPLTAVIVLLTSGAQQLVLLESAFYRVVELTRLTRAVAGACAWAGDHRRCPHAGPSRRSARRVARGARRRRGPYAHHAIAG